MEIKTIRKKIPNFTKNVSLISHLVHKRVCVGKAGMRLSYCQEQIHMGPQNKKHEAGKDSSYKIISAFLVT